MKTLVQNITHRATCRNFTSRTVEPALIKTLLEGAVHAPNTGNMQLYSIIITRDAENKKLLDATHFNQPAAVNAPVIITFCADCHRYSRWCRMNDADPGADNLQMLACASIDAVIVAQQFVTLAEANGLGTCYLGTTTYNTPQIARLLQLPPLVVPVVGVAVGYPAGKCPQTDRLPLDAVIFSEAYNDPDEDRLSALYAPQEQLPGNKKFVKENQKQNLAQVFAQVRYPRASNEAFSQTYRQFILDAGFKI